MCSTIALGVISAGASLFQGYAQAQSVKAQSEAQARAQEANARIAQQKAHDAIERGGEDELALRRNIAQQKGHNRAAMASAGIDIDSGTAQDIQNASIQEGEHDAAAIRFNAARERWGYITQSENLLQQAAMSRANGQAAAGNALFGGILNAGQGIAGMYYQNAGSSPLTASAPLTSYQTWGSPYREKRLWLQNVHNMGWK